jgi:hypothetical protein
MRYKTNISQGIRRYPKVLNPPRSHPHPGKRQASSIEPIDTKVSIDTFVQWIGLLASGVIATVRLVARSAAPALSVEAADLS